jgi:predicted dehydrogenase
LGGGLFDICCLLYLSKRDRVDAKAIGLTEGFYVLIGRVESVETMKVIQAGIGGMGNTWLNAVLQSQEIEYAGFVEINDSIADAQAQRYGLDRSRIFHSLEEALAEAEADGVIDVTPPQFHPQISMTALEAGIPVLSEKPLADTLESASAIVRKANETGVLHVVAQNRRYSVPVQTLKAVIDSGRMGRIASVSVEFYKAPHFGGFREEMPYPLIIDMAIHHFDLMRFFLGRDAVSLFGRSWNPAWSWYKSDASAALVLEFGGGIPVSYEGSWCATGVETAWNGHWRFECENGVILMRDEQVYIQSRLDARQEMGGFWQYQNEAITTVSPARPEYTDQSYLLHEFYKAITDGHTPATRCQDNIQSLAIVFGALRSFEAGRAVSMSEMLDGLV